MPTKIVVVSDTHFHTWSEISADIRKAIAKADIAVHCGDFVRMDVIEGMREASKKCILVHGNSDPVDVREALPYIEIVEVEGVKIGVIHPAWGGPEFEPEALLPDFEKPVDVILYGHLHETVNEERNGILFVNPGQGYSSFMVPATIAILIVDNGKVSASIEVVEPAR